jgi:hypothetical protein
MLQNLPPEIIARIAEEISPEYVSSTFDRKGPPILTNDKPKTFVSLSTVCHNLRDVLLPYLFDRISLDFSYNTLLSKEDSLSAAERPLVRHPDLAVYVR